MQLADTVRKGTLPPPQRGDNVPGISDQLQQLRASQRRILLRRSIQLWWYPVFLIIIGVALAAIAGIVVAVVGQNNPGSVAVKCLIIAAGIAVGLVFSFLAIRRIEFGLLLLAIVTTTFFPQLFAVKSLAIYPSLLVVLLLFCALGVQLAFHVRERILPSFWAIWPLLGLAIMAIISIIMIQLTWTPGVPRKLNSIPVLYYQLLGIALCFIPLITLVVTTTALTNRERYVEYVQRIFLVLAVIAAATVVIEFKRIDASIYTFRYSEPTIFWMKLKDLAHLMCLGTMIAYTRLLYATRWRTRLIYLLIIPLCLLGIYFTLENSWWLEIIVALAVITAVYSYRLFLAFCVLCLPMIPLIKAELAKLATVKTADYYRLIIWQDALRVWRKQPLFGVGPGDFYIYDQHFTQLPQTMRDFTKTGLGVAHNGYLQILAEMGPMGLFFWCSMIVVIAYVCSKLFRRSPVPKQKSKGLVKLLDLNLAQESENRGDRMLALVGLGLICGSAVADFFSGGFMIPARQIDSLQWIPHATTSWIIWGCVMYKDQLWRMAQRGLKLGSYKLQN